ncbi:MAG TPA: thiamine-phosphate kinase [Thermoplasmata archaeon]|nr:thiamine-phosphate kinase [Thermoplasmata archaeon]
MPPSSPRGSAPIREREFHAWLAAHLEAGTGGLLPLGDDAAALTPPEGRVAVLTTDSLVEGTHFLRDSPPERVGAAAAAVSLSDAAAKGATPAALLLALLLPRGTPSKWAESVALGADRMGARFGAPLVGGDTKPSPVRAVVSTVLAWGREDCLAPRTGARPGDLVVTTGTVGHGGWAAHRWTASGSSKVRRRAALLELLRVEPRVYEGVALAPWAHAMLDTSDGLAEASRLLAEASRVRVVIEEDALPLYPALDALPPSERWPAAFYGGDYELLATLPPTVLSRARTAVEKVGRRLTVIGRVDRGSGSWLESAGARHVMPPGGWQPFDAPHRRPK